MYSYTYDEATGGIVLNSSPVQFSKEPRPVWASEMNLLGFDEYWCYDAKPELPYLWAEANVYYYRGQKIASLHGGNLYDAPTLAPELEAGRMVVAEGSELLPVDVGAMCHIKANAELMAVMESETVKKIVRAYEKFKGKLDIFHVAFSGGKDSAVMLDLIKKTLPQGSFVVIFGDTGMEFPDTYDIVEKTKQMCASEGIPFYTARSHFDPQVSWRLFGPPARVLRWCCSVHKSAPQVLKLRQITQKNDYTGLDFVGVRRHESVRRSTYEYENYGKKQKGQYSFNPILDWTSAEVWLYVFMNGLPINAAYKKGNSRAGCLLCPMGGGRNDFVQRTAYQAQVDTFVDLIKQQNKRLAGNEKALNTYVSKGGWNARRNGRDIYLESNRYSENIIGENFTITVTEPRADWKEWIKTLGDVPFDYKYEASAGGYTITCNYLAARQYPSEFKKFKQVFKKAAHCVGCRTCEANCKNGCISFVGGLSISDCVHCGQCHDITEGCLLCHSVSPIKGSGNMKKESINSFSNHAPKTEWLRDFFNKGNEFLNDNTLGPNQKENFIKFLRFCELLDPKTKQTTDLFDVLLRLGWKGDVACGILLTNLVYGNRQVSWYVETFDCGTYYSREHVSDLLSAEGLSKDAATSVINAFKRFCDLPFGTNLNFGYAQTKQIGATEKVLGLCRTKCRVSDLRVLLYALYKFAEKCGIETDGGQFSTVYLYDESVERDGVSPVRLFGLYDELEFKSMLLGLSARYPDFMNATFTNDLRTISLHGKSSKEVLGLFEE